MAYALYMTTNTFLAAAVVAAVLYYGGSLVLEGAMSAGALVSFMLYQQSLSGAFQVGRAGRRVGQRRATAAQPLEGEGGRLGCQTLAHCPYPCCRPLETCSLLSLQLWARQTRYNLSCWPALQICPHPAPP